MADFINSNHLPSNVAAYLFLQEKNGLIWDEANTHKSKEVIYVIESSNLTQVLIIIFELIDAGLTSIGSPPDVTCNKSLKAYIKSNYEEHMNNLTRVSGKKIKISREHFVSFIEGAYSQINTGNCRGNQYISKSFEI